MKPKGLFFNIPGYGHVNPTLPMVKELVDRGEQIDYCCTEEFRAMIERTGARFVPLPEDLVYETNEKFNLLEIFAELIERCYYILPALEQLITREGYEYLLVDMYTPWGRLLAEKLNLPIMVFFPSFALHPKLKEPFHSKWQLVTSFGTSFTNGLRLNKFYKKIQKEHAVPTVNFLDYLAAEIDAPCITFTAQEFQPQRALFPPNYLFTGPNINVDVRLPDLNFPMEKLEGKTVIYISLGSVVVRRDFIKTCIKAFEDSDYVVVLNISKSYKKEEFVAPSNVILCNFAPQLEILAKADLFVTHGGMNSTHEGIFFEVPLVVVPQGGDQFLVAQTVEHNKLGKWLNRKRLSPEKLLRTVEELIDDKQTKQNLKKMSQALKNAGGYLKAADEVQAFISRALKANN